MYKLLRWHPQEKNPHVLHAGIGFSQTIPDGGERRWLDRGIGTHKCSSWSWLGGVGMGVGVPTTT